jgi:metal-dependent amidase/aminoacylase/carboxypeptidase family protein
MSAVNSIRETFRESDYIRVHPIITKGGDIVNVIPSEVRIETFVRGKTMKGILAANKKVDRALAGGAIAMGARVRIEDLPGYYPYTPDAGFIELEKEIFSELTAPEDIGEPQHTTGSTDMGDLSALMPVIQPYVGGAAGGLHSADFRITDPQVSYILGAKVLALSAIELLYGRAERAESILEGFVPLFKTKQEYFDFEESLFRSRVYDEGDLFRE